VDKIIRLTMCFSTVSAHSWIWSTLHRNGVISSRRCTLNCLVHHLLTNSTATCIIQLQRHIKKTLPTYAHCLKNYAKQSSLSPSVSSYHIHYHR